MPGSGGGSGTTDPDAGEEAASGNETHVDMVCEEEAAASCRGANRPPAAAIVPLACGINSEAGFGKAKPVSAADCCSDATLFGMGARAPQPAKSAEVATSTG